jgi:hypothetical protein
VIQDRERIPDGLNGSLDRRAGGVLGLCAAPVGF